MKMYFLVLYNLSPIPQWIQAGHAAVEYMLKYGNEEATKDRAENHKTFIVLNGGTSVTMEQHLQYLRKNHIKEVYFVEPDFRNLITAIAFLSQDDIEYFTNNFKLA